MEVTPVTSETLSVLKNIVHRSYFMYMLYFFPSTNHYNYSV